MYCMRGKCDLWCLVGFILSARSAIFMLSMYLYYLHVDYVYLVVTLYIYNY